MRKSLLLELSQINTYTIPKEDQKSFFKINCKSKKKEKQFKSQLSLNIQSQQFVSQFLSLQSNIKSEGPCEQQINRQLNSTFYTDKPLQFNKRQPRKKINKPKSIILNQFQAISINKSQKIFQQNIKDENDNKKGRKIISYFSSIQNFQLFQKIGQGSYSQVFCARQKQIGWICSIKILSKQKIKKLQIQQNIMRQIKIQNYINHPYITKLYAFFHDQNNIYLITELATDNNLYNMLQKKNLQNKICQIQIPNVIGQLCQSVRYLHSLSIIHRDIKPQNILITFNNNIKLCDFGWAVYNPQQKLRSTFCGTPLYLAPQMIAQSSYDQSIDLWALGIITYQLFSGKTPFKIRSVRQIKKIITDSINYQNINNKNGIQFMKMILNKQKDQRRSIQQIIYHPFLQPFFQDKKKYLE